MKWILLVLCLSCPVISSKKETLLKGGINFQKVNKCVNPPLKKLSPSLTLCNMADELPKEDSMVEPYGLCKAIMILVKEICLDKDIHEIVAKNNTLLLVAKRINLFMNYEQNKICEKWMPKVRKEFRNAGRTTFLKDCNKLCSSKKVAPACSLYVYLHLVRKPELLKATKASSTSELQPKSKKDRPLAAADQAGDHEIDSVNKKANKGNSGRHPHQDGATIVVPEKTNNNPLLVGNKIPKKLGGLGERKVGEDKNSEATGLGQNAVPIENNKGIRKEGELGTKKDGQKSKKGGQKAGKSGQEVRKSGHEPGKIGHEAEKIGQEAGKSGQEPGKGGLEPGKGGQEPGKSGQEPGKGGQEPGKSGQEPGKDGHESKKSGQEQKKGGHEPGKGKQEPAKGGQEPAKGGQEPVKTGQGPGKTGQELEKTGQEPAKGKQEPGKGKQEPVKIGQKTGKARHEPGKTGQEPRKTGQEPEKSGQKPGKSGQEPEKSGQKPGKNGQDPEKSGQEPEKSGQEIKEESGQQAKKKGQDKKKKKYSNEKTVPTKRTTISTSKTTTVTVATTTTTKKPTAIGVRKPVTRKSVEEHKDKKETLIGDKVGQPVGGGGIAANNNRGDEGNSREESVRLIKKPNKKFPQKKAKNSHFITFFIVGCLVVFALYIVYVKKQKIMGLIVEGRGRQRSSSSRRSSGGSTNGVSGGYKKLPQDDLPPPPIEKPESIQKFIY